MPQRRSSPIIPAFTVLLLAATMVPAAGPAIASATTIAAPQATGRSQASFFIGKVEMAGEQRVDLTLSTGFSAACVFKYSTSLPLVGGGGGGGGGRLGGSSGGGGGGGGGGPGAVLQQLAGVCVRKGMGYWSYELCFGQSVTQSHGRESFSLGRYEALHGARQLYAGGTLCEALRQRATRRSELEFVCDAELGVKTVEETATCEYLFVVGTPLVCGHRGFRNAADADARGGGGGGGGAVTAAGLDQARAAAGVGRNQYEAWVLEISELGGGQVACHARSAEDLAKGPGGRWGQATLLHFDSFDFALSSWDAALPVRLFSARHPGRRALADAEVALDEARTRAGSRAGLVSLAAFSGELEYLHLQAGVQRLLKTGL